MHSSRVASRTTWWAVPLLALFALSCAPGDVHPTDEITPRPATEPSLTRPLEFTPAREQPEKATPSESSGSPRVPTPAPPCGSATPLSVSPVDPQSLASITPLGNLNPSSHTFPTSHTYMHVRQPATGAPTLVEIAAPSDGQIVTLSVQHSNGPRGSLTDYSMEIFICGGIHLVFIHFSSIADRLSTAVAGAPARCNEYETGGTQYRHCPYFGLKIPVNAGEVLGKVGGTFDFGAYDLAGPSRPGFVNPNLYHAEARYNLCPYDLYSGPIRETFKQLMKNAYAEPPADPGCGKVDQDLPGTANGNWFGGLNPATPEDENIALVHNVARQVGQPVFSIGRTLPGIESGIYPFTPRTTGFVNRDFGAVVQGNVYCYEDFQVFNRQGNAAGNTILVSLAAERELLVEVQTRPDCGSAPFVIGPGASRYRR